MTKSKYEGTGEYPDVQTLIDTSVSLGSFADFIRDGHDALVEELAEAQRQSDQDWAVLRHQIVGCETI